MKLTIEKFRNYAFAIVAKKKEIQMDFGIHLGRRRLDIELGRLYVCVSRDWVFSLET